MESLIPFHPAVRRWFAERLGEPTPPQREGWPLIREGRHTLIAAPTGSGKTLAAFLSAIDALLRQGHDLPDQTQVLYVSPLRALSNDIQKNLQGPLAEIRATDPFLPEIRVLVRTGDTPSAERAAMTRRPPHILVTTPESLYLLLTSEGGRGILATVRTVIVDEIHALVRDKRGAHLALSLERLEALVGRPFQRVGLSATQKPLDEVGRFLVGAERDCALVDAGTFRALDLAVEVPPSPLGTVCSHEQWEEIYARIADLVRAHRTTLVFVNTRKMAERIAAQLTKLLGEDAVTSHHGSLARERRLDAEQRLKAGALRALVATASLELGIDIGPVDLVVQVGATRSIATFLQRVGRSGHALQRVPKGRLFPLTLDELVEAAALLRCIRQGVLDRTPQPPRPPIRSASGPRGRWWGRSTRPGRSRPTAATSSSSATPRGASFAWSPAWCAWPTPRVSLPACPSGWARGRAARASWPRRSGPCAKPAWRLAHRPWRPCGPSAAKPFPRGRPCRWRSTSRRAAGPWARYQPPRASSWSASSTRAAACSSWCTRPSARASTRPGAWPCASGSASASACSCRRRPTRRRSCSRWGRSTASPWRRSSTTCTRARPRTCSCRPFSPRRSSRRAGGGTPSARSCWSARATARRCRPPCCACGRATCWPRPSRRSWPARRPCPAGRSSCPTTPSCARRSRTA